MTEKKTSDSSGITLEQLEMALKKIATEKGCYSGLTLILRMPQKGPCSIELTGADIHTKMMKLGIGSGSLPEALQAILDSNVEET